MRYRDLKDERDSAIARALEAERLSMKSEFDRVTAAFEEEKARMRDEADERVRKSYLRGFADGSNAMAYEYTACLAEVRPPKPPLDRTVPMPATRAMSLPEYVKVCRHVWDADETGVRCCALCGEPAGDRTKTGALEQLS